MFWITTHGCLMVRGRKLFWSYELVAQFASYCLTCAWHWIYADLYVDRAMVNNDVRYILMRNYESKSLTDSFHKQSVLFTDDNTIYAKQLNECMSGSFVISTKNIRWTLINYLFHFVLYFLHTVHCIILVKWVSLSLGSTCQSF